MKETFMTKTNYINLSYTQSGKSSFVTPTQLGKSSGMSYTQSGKTADQSKSYEKT